jgi:hypothetical protein
MMKKKFVFKKELVHLKNELAQIAAASHVVARRHDEAIMWI